MTCAAAAVNPATAADGPTDSVHTRPTTAGASSQATRHLVTFPVR